MVTRIKKIILFLEERKKRLEEQIRIKNEEIFELNEKKEKLIREIKKLQEGFFSEIKMVKKSIVNIEFRLALDFCKSKVKEIESIVEKIESEIAVLKTELIGYVQRLKALEKYKNKLEQKEKASITKEEEKMINNLIMVRYCDK